MELGYLLDRELNKLNSEIKESDHHERLAYLEHQDPKPYREHTAELLRTRDILLKAREHYSQKKPLPHNAVDYLNKIEDKRKSQNKKCIAEAVACFLGGTSTAAILAGPDDTAVATSALSFIIGIIGVGACLYKYQPR